MLLSILVWMYFPNNVCFCWKLVVSEGLIPIPTLSIIFLLPVAATFMPTADVDDCRGKLTEIQAISINFGQVCFWIWGLFMQTVGPRGSIVQELADICHLCHFSSLNQ